jgi:hypothetical protein
MPVSNVTAERRKTLLPFIFLFLHCSRLLLIIRH